MTEPRIDKDYICEVNIRGYRVLIYKDRIAFDDVILHTTSLPGCCTRSQQVDDVVSHILSKELKRLTEHGKTIG